MPSAKRLALSVSEYALRFALCDSRKTVDDKALLKSLVEESLLTQEGITALSRDSVSLKRGIEELLTERRMVEDGELARVKGKLLGIPYKSFSPDELSKEILAIIPESTARNYSVVALSRDKNLLVVGMLHPDDVAAQEALRYIAKQERVSLGVYVITKSDLDAALRLYSPFANEIQQAVRSLNVSSDVGTRRVQLEAGGGKMGDEAPIIKIVSTLLKEAVNQKASDIHIEPQRSRLRVRFRVDGRLKEQTSLPAGLQQPVISRVKVLSDLKIDENRVSQDGRFRTEIFGRDIDFRISTFPTPLGEKVAIRVLDPTTGLKSLSDLGLTGQSEKLLRAGLERPFGMVLLTGPTGSGKTTTLYALLQIMNKEGVNIVSLEDPVEYFVEGVNQSQVKPEIGYDFASGLRQILRQDPDIIMVGEIRDGETAGLAVHAALTGHIVFSTLHTNNAVGVIPRLIDMGVDAFLIPSAVNLMVSQRLLGRICESCKTTELASPEVATLIHDALETLPKVVREGIIYKAPYQIYHGRGCEICSGKGISGRIGIFEVLSMTKELAGIVDVKINEKSIAEEAVRQGMITLRQDGILKALEGYVLIEEVLRETVEE